MGQFADWVVNLVKYRQRTNPTHFDAVTAQGQQQLDSVLRLNSDRKSAVLPNGRTVPVIIGGTPTNTEAGILVGNNTYYVQHQTQPARYLRGGAKGYILLGDNSSMYDVDSFTSVSLIQLGDNNVYAWRTNNPISISGNGGSRYCISNDGRHLAYVDFVLSLPHTTLSTLSYTVGTWKDFQLDKDTLAVTSPTMNTVSGGLGNAFIQDNLGDTFQHYPVGITAYTRNISGIDRLFIDFTANTPVATLSPFSDFPGRYTTVVGCCPELGLPGVQTDTNFQTLCPELAGAQGSSVYSTHQMRSVGNVSAGTLVVRTNPFPPAPTIHIDVSTPNGSPSTLIESAPNTNGYPIATDTLSVQFNQFLPELASPAGNVSGAHIDGLDIRRVKAVDSDKFYVQKMTGIRLDTFWDLEISKVRWNGSSLITEQTVQGTGIPLEETDKVGTIHGEALYFVLDIAITDSIENVS